MMHPDTRLQHISDAVGLGVVATRPIPRGTIVWMRDALDQVVSPERAAAMPPALRAQLDRYAYRDVDGSLVLAWDHGRHMNHSCDPSTTSIGISIEVAGRDLAPGEEITCEYWIGHFTVPFTCTCGAPNCRGASMAPPTDADRARWDEETAAAYASALTVAQPLLDAASEVQPAAWILRALREKRAITLPSWAAGAPASAWQDGPAATV